MTDLKKIIRAIKKADAVLIGAGIGLSEAAGYHYSGEKFNEDFKDYVDKYNFKDLYTSSFYQFETEEEKWAYWAKHIYFAYYENEKSDLYKKIYELIKEKDYFVITTNTDGKFIQNNFEKNRVFEVQGSYSEFQCSGPCHDKLYDNEKFVYKALMLTKNLKVPTDLIPRCPICGEEMLVNLRHDDRFVEDSHWKESQNNYHDFLKKYKGKRIVLLEFGVGFNTPGIIRFPFEQMTANNHNAKLIRINKTNSMVPEEIEERSISVSGDISNIINKILYIKRQEKKES